MSVMSKKKPPASPPPDSGGDEPKKPYPSRAKVKYLLVPVEYYEEIVRMSEEEERQISTIAKRLIRRGFEAEGRPVPKPKPPGEPSKKE